MPKTEPSHLINFSFRPTIIVFNGCDQEWHPTTEQTKNVPSVQDSMELFTPWPQDQWFRQKRGSFIIKKEIQREWLHWLHQGIFKSLMKNWFVQYIIYVVVCIDIS